MAEPKRKRLRLLSLRDPNPPNLWRIGYALALSVLATLLGLGLLWWLALAILHFPRLPHPSTLALHDAVGVIQLVFASVAGAGALVALVVGYRGSGSLRPERFTSGVVSSEGAYFAGSEVSFHSARFSGGTVDFSQAVEWSRPPIFDFGGSPPDGVLLPPEAAVAQRVAD